MAKYMAGKQAILLFILGWMCFFSVEAQHYKLTDSLVIEGSYFTVDKLEQIYAWDDRGQIIKYGGPSSLQFVYDDFTLGPLTHIDVSDPLMPLLFYDNYMVVRILDRTLNLQAELNLNTLGLLEVHCAALSRDKHLWVYDNAANVLYKINTNGDVLHKSQDLRLLTNTTVEGQLLLEKNNTVYLFEQGKGVHLFDLFGNYDRFIPLKNWIQPVTIIPPQQILYAAENSCKLYNINSFLEKDFSLPDPFTCKDFFVVKNEKLYVLKGKKIYIYVFR